MKLCILGDIKFEKEIEYLKNELSINYDVIVPLFDYINKKDSIKIDIRFYKFVRDYILMSDYIIIIVEDKKDKTFIFNFGIVFGSNKRYKVINIEKIKNML